MNYRRRREKVATLLAELELEAILIFNMEMARYLCGFTGSDGALLVTRDAAHFLTDSRYTNQARAQVDAERIVEYRLKDEGVLSQLEQAGVGTIGFEAGLSYGFARSLQEKSPDSWRWQSLDRELDRLRLIKEPEEVAQIRTAAEANLDAFNEIREMIRPGVSEREVSLALEFALKRRGAEEKAFDFIVASGERGALPHGVASGRILRAGELVTIDFGCRMHGYHSDETVTLALGDVPPELRKVHEVVLEAHDRALDAVAPGIPLIELDRVARSHIEAEGYGACFGHGLGHGVGLEVHEAPTVSPRSTLLAEEGMIFTIEPGIYLPDIGGVRIEDMVLVTACGSETLTKIPKTFSDLLVD